MKIIDKRNESTRQLTLGDLEPGECFTIGISLSPVRVKTMRSDEFGHSLCVNLGAWLASNYDPETEVTRVPATLIIGSEDDE